MNYNIVMYGKTNNLNNIFESGTKAGLSGFKQTNADLNTLYAPYSYGYKTYFTQEFLGNTTTIPTFPFQVAGVSMGTLYNFKQSLFFTATGNDPSILNFNPYGFGFTYGVRFNASGGTINFKTDTLAYVCLVGGGGGGGRNNTSTPRGAGGGGGGAVNTMYFPMKNNITYSFTIGGGGSGSVTSGTRGGNGLATSMSWTMNATSYTISARGGGGGGAGGSAAHAGGSGGGACASAAAGLADVTPVVTNGPISYSYTNNIISGQYQNGIPVITSFNGSFTNGSISSGEGYLAGYASAGGTAANNGGGGGGGAGAAGTGSAGAAGGKGGDGTTVLGFLTVGGGGGGGSGSGSVVGGAGGSGGGGRGSNNGEGGVAGTANTGGGGGGSDNTAGNGGVGGSGVACVFF